jgi:hypothetical protein
VYIYAENAWLKKQFGSGHYRQKRYLPSRTAAEHSAPRYRVFSLTDYVGL